METLNHECYVSLEVAKLLKEAGFNWEVKTYYCYLSPYDEYNLEFDSISTNYNHLNNADFSAPTLNIAQRWLREVKNMSVEILFEKPGKWSCGLILDTNKGISFENFWIEEFDYDIYEQAQEAGIKKALGLILEKGK